jgi:hypothetical protein
MKTVLDESGVIKAYIPLKGYFYYRVNLEEIKRQSEDLIHFHGSKLKNRFCSIQSA